MKVTNRRVREIPRLEGPLGGLSASPCPEQGLPQSHINLVQSGGGCPQGQRSPLPFSTCLTAVPLMGSNYFPCYRTSHVTTVHLREETGPFSVVKDGN